MVYGNEVLVSYVYCEVVSGEEVGAKDGYCNIGDDKLPSVRLSLHGEVDINASIYLQGLTIDCGDDWASVGL